MPHQTCCVLKQRSFRAFFQCCCAVWPAEVEECIAGETLPSAELDLDVSAFGRVCCAMLDIPVHQSLKESLHVLFTLYAAPPRSCASND